MTMKKEWQLARLGIDPARDPRIIEPCRRCGINIIGGGLRNVAADGLAEAGPICGPCWGDIKCIWDAELWQLERRAAPRRGGDRQGAEFDARGAYRGDAPGAELAMTFGPVLRAGDRVAAMMS